MSQGNNRIASSCLRHAIFLSCLLPFLSGSQVYYKAMLYGKGGVQNELITPNCLDTPALSEF